MYVCIYVCMYICIMSYIVFYNCHFHIIHFGDILLEQNNLVGNPIIVI